MKLNSISILRTSMTVVMAACFLGGNLQAQDGVYRLMNRASEIQWSADRIESGDVSGIEFIQEVPVEHEETVRVDSNVDQVAWQEEVNTSSAGFATRDGAYVDPNSNFYSTPIRRDMWRDGKRPQVPHGASPDELIYDGYDRGRPVMVDQDWTVYGLDTEDTVGHFDTLDGRRLVSPSNRVAIYAPRFGTVRQVSDSGEAGLTTRTSGILDRQHMVQAGGRDFSSTTAQYEQSTLHSGSDRPSGFIDSTRGVTGDNVVEVLGLNNQFAPYENFSIMRWGRYNSSEGPRLAIGLQSASAWQDNLGLQVVTDRVQPVIVNDQNRVQVLEHIETEGDNHVLRVLKLASQLAAQPGDEVEFSIRFDNLSRERIGNVTIIDNLTARLEYVPGSAQCSHEGDFVVETNEAGSLQLRWEIRDPIDPGTGGLIRFKCRVR
ncbi:MAG: hypothetical protein AAF456_12090 [Planctomycetota bacterium]